MPLHKNERGQALIVIVLALVVFIGFIALVIDGGNVFLDRRRSQNAADSAALAAALLRVRGEDWVGGALKSAADNGYINDGQRSVVTIYSPPSNGPFAGNLEYIQVTITSNVTTYFARVIGISQYTNIAEATARSKPSEVKEVLQGMAVVSLAPDSNCSNKKAFWIHGTASLQITGGGVFVNSNNRECAFTQQGNGSIRILDTHQINVVGAASIQKAQLLTPGITVGAPPFSYPPPFFMPAINCGEQAAELNADGTSMTPGTWDDTFPPKDVTVLEPGVYCLSDGFSLTGNQEISGTNVTFIVLNGEVQLNGTSNAHLDAPDTGEYKGLLFYLPLENTSQVVLNGGASSTFIGTVLAPSSEIVINGNNSPTGFQSQIIGYRVNVDGTGNVVITYKDDQNYDAVSMPEVQLSE